MSTKSRVASARSEVIAGCGPGEEGPDLGDHALGLQSGQRVRCARKLDEPGALDPGRQVSGGLDVGDGIAGPVHHERRHADGREDVADVGLGVHPLQGKKGGRARPRLAVAERPVEQGRVRVRAEARARAEEVVQRGPVLGRLVDRRLPVLGARPPRVVVRSSPAGLASPDQEGMGATGIGGGEEARHRGALRHAEDRGAAAPGGVHDRPDVVGALLERGSVRRPVGQPRAALVEADEPGERRQRLDELRLGRLLPVEVEMGDGSRCPDEVDGPGPRHLVGDADRSAGGVADGMAHDTSERSRAIRIRTRFLPLSHRRRRRTGG